MADDPDDPKTPTDVLIQAMEHAEDMEQTIVIAKIKNDNEGGFTWFSNIDGCSGKFALMEEVKIGMFAKTYGLTRDD